MHDQSEKLDAAIAEYIQMLEAGQRPDPRTFLERYPDLRDGLESFLADYDGIRAAVEGYPYEPEPTTNLPSSSEPTPVAPHAAPTSTPGTTPADREADLFAAEPMRLPRQFGDYELLELIAHGGMGVVYKARQRSLDRIVAVKMILAGQLASSEDIQRFFIEARAAGRLDHPSIVPVFEVGTCEGQHFFSMGFVDGASLADELHAGPLDQVRATNVALAIAEAVAYAHAQGIVHRDIKPGNVLIDKGGSIKITDFGLATRTDENEGATVTGQILGTPAYMPPEQATGRIEDVGPLSDVYSLGAVLYCLLTGRPPFQAPHPAETLWQVIHQEPVSPRQLNRAISVDLETICLKCLEKEASHRYGSARELVDDLSRCRDHQPIRARPIGRLAKTAKLIRRHRLVSLLMAIVALSLMLGTGISSWFAVESRARAEAEFKARQELEIKEQETSRLATEKSALVEQQTATITQLKDNLYVSRLREAQAALDAGNYEGTRQLLEMDLPLDGEPDRRCFAWYYLRHQFQQVEPDYQVLSGPKDMMTRGRIVVAPNGKEFAVAFRETIWLGDFETGQLTRTIVDPRKTISDIGFSRDSRYLALVRGGAYGNPAKSPTLAHGGIELHDLNDPNAAPIEIRWQASEESTQHDYGVCVAFSPTQDILACGLAGGRIALHDYRDNIHLGVLTPPDLSDGVVKDFESLAFTPDGHQIVSVRYARSVDLWDVDSQQHVRELRRYQTRIPFRDRYYRSATWEPDPSALAITSDGSFIAVAGNGLHFDLIHLESGRRKSMVGHSDAVTSLQFLPDGQTLVSGSLDHDIRLWDVRQGAELARIGSHRSAVHGIGVSPSGRTIISAGTDNRMLTWNMPAPEGPPEILHSRNHVYDLAFLPNSNRLVSGGWPTTGTTIQWDVVTGERFPMKRQVIGRVYDLDVSSSGDVLVTANLEGKGIDVWNRQRDFVRRLQAGMAVTRISVHPDGKLAAMGHPTVAATKIVDLETGALLKQVEASQVRYSPTGNQYVGIHGGRLRMWDATTDRELTVSCPHVLGRPVYSPDGRMLALQSDETEFVVLDVNQRRVRFEADAHGSLLTDFAFSPDGKTLASVGSDARILLWDIETGRLKTVLTGHTSGIQAVAFNATGTILATAGIDGTIRLWRAPRPSMSEIRRFEKHGL